MRLVDAERVLALRGGVVRQELHALDDGRREHVRVDAERLAVVVAPRDLGGLDGLGGRGGAGPQVRLDRLDALHRDVMGGR